MQLDEYDSMIRRLEDANISAFKCLGSMNPEIRLSTFDEFLGFCKMQRVGCILTYARDSLPWRYLIPQSTVSGFILLDGESEFIQGLVNDYNRSTEVILGKLGDVTEAVFVEPISKVGYSTVEWERNNQIRSLPNGDTAAASLFKRNAGEIFELACSILNIEVPVVDYSDDDDGSIDIGLSAILGESKDFAGLDEVTEFDYRRVLEGQLWSRLVTDERFTANGTQKARGEFAYQFARDPENIKYLVLARYMHQNEKHSYARSDAEWDLNRMMEVIYQNYKVQCRKHKITAGTPLTL